jgi:hypothetical protein
LKALPSLPTGYCDIFEKNTFLDVYDVDESSDIGSDGRPRGSSDWGGICNLQAQGVSRVPLVELRRPLPASRRSFVLRWDGRTGVPLPTTLSLKNLPNELDAEDMLEVLDREEFSGLYDFVFVVGNGSAVVNLVGHEHGQRLAALLHGRTRWNGIETTQRCEVEWATHLQGRDALVSFYREHAANRADAPEDRRPLLFANGWPEAFPPASKP